jgi:prostatic aicd phosphatase
MSLQLICRNGNVLGNTALAFTQGLYPPSDPATAATLTNGTAQFNPLDGYQYVLINGIPADAPETIWLKGDQYCPTMSAASQEYFQSSEYLALQPKLQPFYDSFTPLLEGIFPASQIGYQSAYKIFDYLNEGYIHNQTIYTNLTTDQLFQLQTLADAQELAKVYNSSSTLRSIGGQTLAATILSTLNQTISGTNPTIKLTYMATSYAIFQAFFGISGLLDVSADFYGLPDFASTMSFELRLPSASSAPQDLFVRFSFRNGSDSSAPLTTFPLFGRTQIEADIPWPQFAQAMSEISIPTQQDWCIVCAANLSFCSAYADSSPPEGGMSGVTAGFIGAGIAIAVILVVEALVGLVWYRRRYPVMRRRSGHKRFDLGKKEIMLEDASSVRGLTTYE